MEDLLKALGPWPTLQGIAIGIVVCSVGIWAMRRGMQFGGKDVPIEDVKARWKLYEQIDTIEQNSWKMVEAAQKANELLARALETLNRIADKRWNTHQ